MNKWLTPERWHSLRWSAAAIVAFVVVAPVAYLLLPANIEAPGSAPERVLNTLLQLRWPALVMLLMALSLFRMFDTEKAADPLAGGESHRHRVNQRVLTNSIEQFVLFVPAILGLAVMAEDAWVWHGVRVAVLLFTLGRAAFWVGYHRSAYARAPGFAVGFLTMIAVYAALFWLAM